MDDGDIRQTLGEILGALKERAIRADDFERTVKTAIEILQSKVELATLDGVKYSTRLEVVERKVDNIIGPVEEIVRNQGHMKWVSSKLLAVWSIVILIIQNCLSLFLNHWLGK